MIIVISLSIFVALLAFVGIRMATAPTTLSYKQTITMPELPNLDAVNPADLQERVAVAVDGRIAYKNSDDVQPSASTAKMIMALMVTEKRPIALGETGPTISITSEFYKNYLYYATHNGSFTKVAVGEQISEYDALASALIVSSNNMADTLAIWAFDSMDNYRAYAQARLEEWGLKNTTIGIDAGGYSDTTTSTAADLALIAQKVMEHPVLAEIVGKQNHTVPVEGEIKNTNKTLGEFNIVGVKTGYIGNNSGFCLASAYRLGEHIVTVTVLHSPTREKSFEVSKQVVEKLQSVLAESEIVKQDQEVGYYESWWGGKTQIYASEDMSALAWSTSNASLTLKMDELQEGQEATGLLTFNYNDTMKPASVTTKGLKTKPSFWDRLQYALFMKSDRAGS